MFKRDIAKLTPSSQDRASEGVREGVIRSDFCQNKCEFGTIETRE